MAFWDVVSLGRERKCFPFLQVTLAGIWEAPAQGDCMPNAFRKHKVCLDGNKGHISCGFSVHIILGLRKVEIWKAELMLTVPVS